MCAVKARPHRSYRATDQTSGLFVALLLQIAKYHNFPVTFREGGDGLPQIRGILRLGDFARQLPLPALFQKGGGIVVERQPAAVVLPLAMQELTGHTTQESG